VYGCAAERLSADGKGDSAAWIGGGVGGWQYLGGKRDGRAVGDVVVVGGKRGRGGDGTRSAGEGLNEGVEVDGTEAGSRLPRVGCVRRGVGLGVDVGCVD